MPVACGRQRDAAMTRALLARGASPALCATLRKFLDSCATPRWHEAREVTPAKWGQDSPERGWVNLEGLRFLEGYRCPRWGGLGKAGPGGANGLPCRRWFLCRL